MQLLFFFPQGQDKIHHLSSLRILHNYSIILSPCWHSYSVFYYVHLPGPYESRRNLKSYRLDYETLRNPQPMGAYLS